MESERNFTQELWTKYNSSNHKQKLDPQFNSHDMLALKRINPFPAKESMLLMQFFLRQLVLWARSNTEGYIRVNSSFQKELRRQVRLTRNVNFLDPVLFWAPMNSQTLGRMSYSFWQIEKNTFPRMSYDAIQERKRLIHTWSLGDQGLRINKLPL